MPHIGIAMERSLQHQTWGSAFASLLSRSAVAALDKRQSIDSISNGISDAATAFSSWDNCFQAAICKWPVIALFIIGGLILISIAWCIIRCCCCGLSCCCECCYCLKCCGECCGLCDPPRGKRSQYLDEPFVPPNHDQAYRSHAPMHSGFDSMKPSVPQYAEFDAGDKKNADALPAMPSWEEASSKKVLVEEEFVEMEPLKKPNPAQSPPHMNVAAMPPSSTSSRAVSPYGPPVGVSNQSGYMGPGHNDMGAYETNQQGYKEYDNHGYEQPYPSGGMNNMAGVAAAASVGRRTPHQDYDNGYDRNNANKGFSQYPQSRSPRPYNNEYGRSATPTGYNNGSYQGMTATDGYASDRRSPAPQAGYGYGNSPRMGSPGAQAGYGYGNARRSPAPQADYRYPQRSHTQDTYTPQYPATSQEYSNDSHESYANQTPEQYVRPPPPTSPIRNNSGFDFNSGYSRPGSRASPAPAQTANGGTAYPGYRAYKPASDAQSHTWGGS
ncbi:putative fibroin-3 related protein [Rosellinia necatrix]|uniref:Putative fibroin-3 related protein n=1 Tax=Rosellinia necatrix TaxID=77044 RepID=A0A1W2TDM6_ROSNE|nr:putative fibroin-3 related protein [Rosellinia necatrix]